MLLPSWHATLLLGLLPDSAYGWGELGHRTVAYLAEALLPLSTRLQLPSLTGFDDVSDAAAWADTVVKDPAYSHTATWHYINVNDTPPDHCNVSTSVDWTASNILTALVNQTKVAARQKHSRPEQQEAYRYLIHLIGDLHQPLHVEGLARGGNDIPVYFEQALSSLHVVWDVHMISKHRRGLGDNDTAAAKLWADELLLRDDGIPTRSGCESLNDSQKCFLHWASESNTKVCKHVLHEGLANVENKELSTWYHRHNVKVVEDAIYQAGTRLAHWLTLVIQQQPTGMDYVHADL